MLCKEEVFEITYNYKLKDVFTNRIKEHFADGEPQSRPGCD